MSYPSTTDTPFLATLDGWLRSLGEVLALIRYSHAAGVKDFEFFSSFESLAERLRGLPPRTCVTVFGQPQLPIRGIVDDNFVAASLSAIPDGSEYLLVETVQRAYGQRAWCHYASGESHAELREHLEESRGWPAAAGPYPPWLRDNEDVVSAVVPDENGVVTTGVY